MLHENRVLILIVSFRRVDLFDELKAERVQVNRIVGRNFALGALHVLLVRQGLNFFESFTCETRAQVVTPQFDDITTEADHLGTAVAGLGVGLSLSIDALGRMDVNELKSPQPGLRILGDDDPFLEIIDPFLEFRRRFKLLITQLRIPILGGGWVYLEEMTEQSTI